MTEIFVHWCDQLSIFSEINSFVGFSSHCPKYFITVKAVVLNLGSFEPQGAQLVYFRGGGLTHPTRIIF